MYIYIYIYILFGYLQATIAAYSSYSKAALFGILSQRAVEDGVRTPYFLFEGLGLALAANLCHRPSKQSAICNQAFQQEESLFFSPFFLNESGPGTPMRVCMYAPGM